MPVFAVVNRKRGSGKSTLAAHIAAWCARNGSSVMLGDVDRQQSARSWLKRRDVSLPIIAPWAGGPEKHVACTPIAHAVLDTPGGMHGFELAHVLWHPATAAVQSAGETTLGRPSRSADGPQLSQFLT